MDKSNVLPNSRNNLFVSWCFQIVSFDPEAGHIGQNCLRADGGVASCVGCTLTYQAARVYPRKTWLFDVVW